MRARFVAVVMTALAAIAAVPSASPAAPDAPDACKIQRPDGLWPPFYYDDYWNTYTHGGFNSDWIAHPRPVGTIKAIVLFVDFHDFPASAVTQRAPIDYRNPEPYWDFMKAFAPWYDLASYGRLHIDIHPVLKWYRMPHLSTYYRMDYRTSNPARRLSADGQGECNADAVRKADEDGVDFSGYDLLYVVPARNQTSIASSPELNNYTHQIVADGNDLGNGDDGPAGLELRRRDPQRRGLRRPRERTDDQDLIDCVATPLDTSTPGTFTFKVTAHDANGNEAVATRRYAVAAYTQATGAAPGTVPATLALTLGAAASFGAFTPGVGPEYTAQTTANVISTAGDAALAVSDPGHLTNGTFSLPQPLRVELAPNVWSGPVSNGTAAITFRQAIGAGDALRTGSYAKTLTFTLSTTSP